MKVLVIGGGGREHALAWKLAQSPRVQTVLRGAGQRRHGARPALDERGHHRPRARWPTLPQAEKIGLTVVGPEAPLAAGVVDLFRARGLRIFGPTQAAAQLESSKAFAKDFMQRHGIPTARYATFTDAAAAHAYVDSAGRAHRHQGRRPGRRQGRGGGHDAGRGARGDRLHAGRQHARRAAQRRRRARGDRGVPGRARRPASSCMCDGKNVLPLATSQDHKRLLRRRHRPQHRRHGRLFAGAGGHAQRACAGDARDHPAHRRRHGRGRHALHRLPLRRADDRRAGPAAHGGVQLPPGRPRDAADPDAPEERPARRAAARHRRHARPGRAAMGPPRRAGRGDGRRRLPDGAAQGRRHHRPAGRRRRRAWSSTPAPR